MLTNHILELRRLLDQINGLEPSPSWRGLRRGLNGRDACKRDVVDAATAELELEAPPDDLDTSLRLFDLAGCVKVQLGGDAYRDLFGEVVSATSRLRLARKAALRRLDPTVDMPDTEAR